MATALLRRGSSTYTLLMADWFNLPALTANLLYAGGSGTAKPRISRESVESPAKMTLPIKFREASEAAIAAEVRALNQFLRLPEGTTDTCTLEITPTGASASIWEVFYGWPVQPPFTQRIDAIWEGEATLTLLVNPFTLGAAQTLYNAATKNTPCMISLAAMTGTFESPLAVTLESVASDELHSFYVAPVPTALGIAVDSIDTGTEVITLASTHGWAANDRVFVSAATLPGGLSDSIGYYVKDPSGATLKLSATSGGAAVNITSSGTTVTLYPGVPLWVDAKNLTWSSGTSTADAAARVDNAMKFNSATAATAAWETKDLPAGPYLLLARVKAANASYAGTITTDFTTADVSIARASWHIVELGRCWLPTRQVRGTATASLTISVAAKDGTSGHESWCDGLGAVPLGNGMWCRHPSTATEDVTKVSRDPDLGITYVDDIANEQDSNGGTLAALRGGLFIVSENAEGDERTHPVKVTVTATPREGWLL